MVITMEWISALMFMVVVALLCVGAWAAVILMRHKPVEAPAPFAAPLLPPPSTAAATVVTVDRSAQIDATRKAADARAAEEVAFEKEIAALAAAKKTSDVEPFVGDELSGYL